LTKKVRQSAIVPAVQALSEFSEKEKAPISEIPRLVGKGNREPAQLRADTEATKIEEKKALVDAKLTEETVREFSMLKLGLEAAGLTTKDPEPIVNAASNIKALGRDPKKIIAHCSKVRSFESLEK
jgi:hypothetical protein